MLRPVRAQYTEHPSQKTQDGASKNLLDHRRHASEFAGGFPEAGCARATRRDCEYSASGVWNPIIGFHRNGRGLWSLRPDHGIFVEALTLGLENRIGLVIDFP